MQNAPREHSAILSTFIKLLLVIKNFVLSIWSGCLRQVLLYFQTLRMRVAKAQASLRICTAH